MKLQKLVWFFVEWGFGLEQQEVESVVQEFLKVTNRKNPFNGGVPEGWWSGFLKRHPRISKRKPQHLQMARAQVSRQDIMDHWFNDCLRPTLKKLQLDPQDDPHKEMAQMPHALIPGYCREQITVQTCVSASGQILPPYVVYNGA